MFNWWPFADLINSKACTHEYQLLNFSDLKKVDKTFFKNAIYQSEKKNTFFQQKNFGPNVIYWLPHPPAAARSIQEQLWESKCWFSICFIRKTWFRPTKCCQNHWFYNICKNKVAVAAAALMGGPSRCSHSNFIFANVVKPMILATFFVDVKAARWHKPFTNTWFRQNPYSASTVWGKMKNHSNIIQKS